MKLYPLACAWASLSLLGCAVDYSVKGAPELPEGARVDTAVPAEDGPDSAAIDTGVPAADTSAEEGQDEAVDTELPVDTSVPDDSGDPGDSDPPEEETPAVACAPGADGVPVGCTVEVGKGRLFVWGDEHVRFDDYRPASDRFWRSALTWLTNGERVTVQDRTGSTSVSVAIGDLGLVTGGNDADVVVVDLFGGATGADVATWLDEGRAVMVMAIGFGTEECSYLTTATAGLPLRFDCSAEPWGPVGAFTGHPIATGLSVSDAPFVNGRMVVADEPETAEAVAFVF